MSIPYTELAKPLGDFSLLCRGCLANSGEMKNMNEWGLIDDFCKLTDVQVNVYEESPVLLCTKCEDSLLNYKNFKLQCQQSDMFLQDLIKSKSTSQHATEEANHQETQENSVSCIIYENKLVLTILAPDMNATISLPCPHKCKAKFSKTKFLLTHLINIHNVSKDYSIEKHYYCTHKDCHYNQNSERKKFFMDRKYLNQHLNRVHGMKIVCYVCNSIFTNNTDFDRHVSNCNSTNFVCEICHMRYKTNDRLIVHLMRKHPDLHRKYKEERKTKRKANETVTNMKKIKFEVDRSAEYICDSPKRSFATQTLQIEENIRNDVTLPSWNGKPDTYETKTDEISTQTVFEDLLSIKSQNSEDESIFFSETVSLSDIQTQTFPIEFGLSRCNKETITSETQSPDLSIKETQTCYCLYDSLKLSNKLFDSVSSSPSNISLTSSETQTSQVKSSVKTDVWLSFSSAETQTCFEDGLSKEVL